MVLISAAPPSRYRSTIALAISGNGKILIPPSEKSTSWLEDVTNPITGNLLLSDLMDTAQNKKLSVRYIEPQSNNQIVEGRVNYFKAFDWYFGVAVPVEEIEKPVTTIVTRQTLIICLIFLASLITAYFMVVRMVRPLKLLASNAKQMPKKDISTIAEWESPHLTPLHNLKRRGWRPGCIVCLYGKRTEEKYSSAHRNQPA